MHEKTEIEKDEEIVNSVDSHDHDPYKCHSPCNYSNMHHVQALWGSGQAETSPGQHHMIAHFLRP